MTEAIRTARLTRIYLIALPSFLLTGGLALFLAFWLAPPTPVTVGITTLLLLGILALSGLFSGVFLTVCYAKTQPSGAQLVVMAAVLMIAGWHLGVLFSIVVYAVALYLVRKHPSDPDKHSPILTALPIAAVILLTVTLCLGFVWLFGGDHYYSEPTVGKGGFYYTELIDASLTELVEVDESHCVGVYSYSSDNASDEIGFALYETISEDGKKLYRYVDDSGLCYPSLDAIIEMDSEHYTVSGHDENGFPERQTHSWCTWHRLSDRYAVCMIPASSECLPEEGIEIVQSAEITPGETAFRLYVGIGEAE